MCNEELHDNGMTDEEMIVHLNRKFAKEHVRLCGLERRAGFPVGEYSQCTTSDEIVAARDRLDARLQKLVRYVDQHEQEEERRRKKNRKPYL